VCYTHAKTLAEVVMTTQRRVSRTFGICGGSLCIPLVAHATFVLVRRSVLTPALLDVCGTGRNGQRLQCTKGIRCREATEGVGRSAHGRPPRSGLSAERRRYEGSAVMGRMDEVRKKAQEVNERLDEFASRASGPDVSYGSTPGY